VGPLSGSLAFIADKATYDLIEGAHVAGLAVGDGADGYLLFQRGPEADPDDWGIHLEFNDQANSGYDVIRECRVGRGTVEVDLAKPLNGVIAIKVALSVGDQQFVSFLAGMRMIFRGQEDRLKAKD
jgi:hypothetical protein